MELISFYNQYQCGSHDISEQLPKFLWFQLLKYVVQESPHDDKAKEQMLTVCRQYYQDNPQQLKNIQAFDQNYDSDECIRWYTKNTFLYKLINIALRTEDIQQLYVFRYYIADLSRQLAQKYDQIKTKGDEKIILYRGTAINKQELEQFKANVGKLRAINNYWSTSRDRSYALTFASKPTNCLDTVPVLFEIQCDLKNQNDAAIFADISGLSEFPSEEEFLFDAGSIFLIEKIKDKIDDIGLYVVQMKTSAEGREVANTYIEDIRREMKYQSPRIMLGILLKRIGKYDESLQYFEQLLKDPGEEKIAHIHNRIGIALRHKKRYVPALDHFKKAYDLTSKSDQSERIYSAIILHNKGILYSKRRKFSKALYDYEQAVDILKKEIGDKNFIIGEVYSDIGRVYLSQRDVEKAFEYQQKALEIRESSLPSEHVILAFSYAEIGKLFCFQRKYKQALEYNLKALKLRQKYLLSEHVNIAQSLYYVGRMYYKNCNSEMALDFYFKSLEMIRKCLPPSQHHIVPAILKDIVLICKQDKNLEEASKYLSEARQL